MAHRFLNHSCTFTYLSIKYLSMTNYRAGMTDAADQKEPYKSVTPRTLWSWYHKLYFLNIRNCIITITIFVRARQTRLTKNGNYSITHDLKTGMTLPRKDSILSPWIALAEPHLLLLWGLCTKTSIIHLHNKTKSNTMEKKRNALLQVSGN